MSFQLSARSLGRLSGVHADLERVVQRAIQITPVDFAVIEGLRTPERQRELVASGASQTSNSRHLTGHAVDIAPYVGGSIRWDWPLFYPLAAAMQRAAAELSVPVRWGGCWERLDRIGDPEQAVADYVARRRAAGQRAFQDGPHFELPRDTHP